MNGKSILLGMLIFTLLLSACGGGGTTETQSPSVVLVADKTQAIADQVDKVTLTVTVKDNHGNPIPDQSIQFNLANPHIITPNKTDANGQAIANIQWSPTAPTDNTVVKVTVTSGGVTSNEVSLTFVKPAQIAASVSLVVDKNFVAANNTDTATFTATVKDTNGIPLAGQLLVFTPQPDPTATWSLFTNSVGQGYMTMRSGSYGLTGPEAIAVSVKSGNVTSNAVVVTFTP